MATPARPLLAHSPDTGVPTSLLSQLDVLLEDVCLKHQKDLFYGVFSRV